MGAITSRLPWAGSASPNKTIAKLTKLQDQIERLEKKRVQVRTSQATTLRRMLYFTCSFTLSYAVVAYTVFPSLLLSLGWDMDLWLDWVIVWSPVLILPILYYLLKKQAIRWYNWRLARWTKSIKTKRSEKKVILDNVMDVETYNNAMKIFEQFDRSRLNGAPKFARRSAPQDKQATTKTVTSRFGFSSRSGTPLETKTNSASAGLSADRIRNMAHNYTFSGSNKTSGESEVRRRNLNSTVSTSSGSATAATVAAMRANNAKDAVEKRFGRKERKAVVEEVEIGPAAPTLDADALKLFSRKQGITSKKKKFKKPASSAKEPDSPPSIELIPEQPPIENGVMSPKTKELTDARTKIEALEAEVARLRTLEEQRNQQISVAGKINKALTRSSQKTSSSRAQLIMRAKHVEKQAEKERQRKSKLVGEVPESSSRVVNDTNQRQVAPSESRESLDVQAALNGLDDIAMRLPVSQSTSQQSLLTNRSNSQSNSHMTNDSNSENIDETLRETRAIVTDDEGGTADEEIVVEKESDREDDEGKGNSRDEISIEQEEEEANTTAIQTGKIDRSTPDLILSGNNPAEFLSEEDSDEDAKQVTENQALVTPIQSSSSDEMVT